MNTGHDGSLTTVHANTPRDALSRVENMVLMAGLDLPAKAIREQVVSAINLIVHLTRMRDGSRRVTHISEIVGMESQTVTMQDVSCSRLEAPTNRGAFWVTFAPPACGRSSRSASSNTAYTCRRACSKEGVPSMPFAVAPTVLASSAVFVTILLFGLGVYRIANHGGILARRRVSVFAPARSKAAAADMPGNAPLLLHPPRFSNISILDNLLRRKGRGARLSLKLARAALPMRVGEYLLVRCAVALVLGALAGRALGALVPAVAAGLGGYFLPVLYVRARQKKRVRAFDDQLVDALVLMSNSLKTGYSFMQAMESIVREMPEPIGVEFDQALREIRMGGAIEDALLGISERVRSTDFELVVTAMVIQRQVGGNLTEILSNIAYTIRERHLSRAKSASSRPKSECRATSSPVCRWPWWYCCRC